MTEKVEHTSSLSLSAVQLNVMSALTPPSLSIIVILLKTVVPTGAVSATVNEYGRSWNSGALSLTSKIGISRRKDTVLGSDPAIPSSEKIKFH